MKKLLRKLETLLSAAAFAEANEHRTALEILREGNERTVATPRPVRSTFRGDIAVRPAGSR